MQKTNKTLKDLQTANTRKQVAINENPMNKDFLNAKNEDGSYKYPLAQKMLMMKFLMIDELQDSMRQVAANLDEIRRNKHYALRLEGEILSGNMKSLNKRGELFNEPEARASISASKILEYRCVANIRGLLFEKMLPRINEATFTAEQFNNYTLAIESLVEKEGHTLFPTETELIIPQ